MTAPLATIENLLSRTTEISRRYQETQKITGEGYNLLSLLKMGHYEVKTHSPVIADLLNPVGTHGQGPIFLELFLKSYIREKAPTFMSDASLVTVQKEKHIGIVDEDTATGGRIDIHLQSSSSSKEVLVIENKIYASEGHQQLERYQNYAEKWTEDKRQIVFLTLLDEEPQTAKNNDTSALICLTYEKHIIQWLELCRKEVATIPTVRESLTIYINLLCQLTNQSPNQKMNTDITEAILQSEESMNAYSALISQKKNVQTTAFGKIRPSLEKIGSDLSLEYTQSDNRAVTDRYFNFQLSSIEWKNFHIRFGFESKNCANLIWGFFNTTPMEEKQRNRLRQLFANEFGVGKQSNAWTTYLYWDQYRNWEGDTLTAIVNGRFLEDVREKVIALKKIADSLTQEPS